MILASELDGFRRTLVSTLRQYEGRLALDIGQTTMLGFADSLRTKRTIYQTTLSGYSPSGPSDPRPEAVRRLNKGIASLEVRVRGAASLVESLSELPRTRAALRDLREEMDEVIESMESLIRSVDDTKKVLQRRSRGAASIEPTDGGSRSYRSGPIAGVSEYRRTGTTGTGDYF